MREAYVREFMAVAAVALTGLVQGAPWVSECSHNPLLVGYDFITLYESNFVRSVQ